MYSSRWYCVPAMLYDNDSTRSLKIPNAMLNMLFITNRKSTPHHTTHIAALVARAQTVYYHAASIIHLLQGFASMPSGGRVSTLPLLTSSQFVLSEVPLLSV